MDLPKHPVVHGHPLHAILSDGPAVLIPVAVAIEAWNRKTGTNRSSFRDVASATAAGATSPRGSSGGSIG